MTSACSPGAGDVKLHFSKSFKNISCVLLIGKMYSSFWQGKRKPGNAGRDPRNQYF
jgi:hypothetical protein